MYQEYFQLAERPFTTSPFAPHYFPSRDSEQALNLCHLAIDQATGPVMIIGNSGVGKSMVLAVLAEQYASRFNVVNLTTASLKSPTDLLQNILFELDRPYQEMPEGELRLALMDHLKPNEKCPFGILILADEAHSLNEDVLNELKSITNYVRDGQPRVRLVLAGNPRLEETMTLPRLDSFNQRIAARCYLQPLSKSETNEYIERHMQRVGQSATSIFDRLAIDAIYEITQGIPRLVNQVCCHAMVLAAANGQGPVDRNHVAHAWTDIQQLPAPWDQEAETSSKQLEDWAVIEFGQLDDASEQAASEQAPIEQAPIEQAPIEQAPIEQAAPQPAETSEFHSIQAGQPDDKFDEQSTIAHSDDVSSFSDAVFSTNPFDESYSISSIGSLGSMDGMPTDSQDPETALDFSVANETTPISATPEPDTKNVFGDGFDEEEEVVDEVSRWSAEQNRSSLDVSDSELANLISQADSIQEQIGNSLGNQHIGPETIIQDESASSQGSSTPAGQTQADEIRQLYDIYDNQQQLAKQIAIATQVYDPRDTPSGIEDGATALGSDLNPISIEYPIAEHTSYENPASAAEPAVQSDDRDMLMVSHVDHVPGQKLAPEPGSESEVEPSTGLAKRMNYQTLFQQLRGSDDSKAT